jgi:regulator of PEP synthase PpsR (kinase-PPPase family)
LEWEKFAMTDQTPPHTAFIVSDATGETAYRIVRAALAQFKDSLVAVEWRRGVRTEDAVRAVVAEAAAVGGLIVHTLVVPDLRRVLSEESRRQGVIRVDVMGPALMHFEEWLQHQPSGQPGVTDQIDEDYLRRITALEYAVEHDDGRNPHDLDRADLILVGVSRTSKTPLSMYLAYRGWLVGNVPIVPQIDPPDTLFEQPPGKVIALTVRPERLLALRGVREQWMGVRGNYADPASVREELRHARLMYAKAGWPIVDMSAKSIEEAAAEVLELVEATRAK